MLREGRRRRTRLRAVHRSLLLPRPVHREHRLRDAAPERLVDVPLRPAPDDPLRHPRVRPAALPVDRHRARARRVSVQRRAAGPAHQERRHLPQGHRRQFGRERTQGLRFKKRFCVFLFAAHFMAALRSRCGHYIFALWFLLLPLLFFLPRLISAVAHWMSIILLHMVCP